MRTARFVLFTVLAALSSTASAGNIYESPVGWRLQNYTGNSVGVYWTSASDCPSGGIFMPLNATGEDRDRFWSMILTAKHSGKQVGIYYTSTGTSCTVDSFYVDQ